MSLLTFTAKRRLAVLAATALLVVGLSEAGPGSAGAGPADGLSGRDALARLTQIGDPHPETYHDLAEAKAQMNARTGAPYGVQSGAYASAVAERGAMAAATAAVVPGGDRSWLPLGLSPFVGNPPGFSRTENGGVPILSGRI